MFATNIYHLIVTHVVIGAGLGIVCVPVNVILTEYFRWIGHNFAPV